MRKTLVTMVAIVMLAASATYAGQARIDVEAQDKTATLKVVEGQGNMTGSHPTWTPEDQRPRRLWFRTDLKDDQWRQVQLQFVADKDTKVSILLSGEWKKDDEGNVMDIWTIYDDLETEGTTIPCPGFEQIRDNTFANAKTPVDWHIASKDRPERQAELLGADKARSGQYAVRAAVHRNISTTIEVKGGETVTIRAWAKWDK